MAVASVGTKKPWLAWRAGTRIVVITLERQKRRIQVAVQGSFDAPVMTLSLPGRAPVMTCPLRVMGVDASIFGGAVRVVSGLVIGVFQTGDGGPLV